MRLYLKRIYRNKNNIQGILFSRGFACVTIELPWKDNTPFVSCIPAGIYDCYYTSASKFTGGAIVIENVEGRTDIRIHIANAAHEIEGCTGVGEKIDNEFTISDSYVAFKRLIKYINKGKFSLFIEDYMPKEEVTA